MTNVKKFASDLTDQLQIAKNKISIVTTISDLLALKAQYFGKKNSEFKKLQAKAKLLISNQDLQQPVVMVINRFRTALINSINSRLKEILLLQQEKAEIAETVDLAENSFTKRRYASEHLFAVERRRIIKFFYQHNFKIIEGTEVVSEADNFRSLNISKHHVSNDKSDTFYIKNKPGYLLRTHCTCSTVAQLSLVASAKKRDFLNFITFGKAFRNDTHDATHLHEFYQLDGCMIGPQWNITTLVKFLQQFLVYFFDHEVETRWRVSYFPFTRPSLEMDIRCPKCIKNGCDFCKNTTWIEILGAGIVHQRVLELTKLKLNPAEQVVAFGLGIERIIMLRHKIYDIRWLYNHDLRWLATIKQN